jgi:glutamate dehydrogenase (NADP+)
MRYPSHEAFLSHVEQRDHQQPEFLQAVSEVMESVWPFIQKHPRYAEHGLLDRLVEPERVVQFRISWVDDAGEVRVNRGFRIQHSSAIGPFKGGMRFHPTVNLSILKFLAFEQTFKNALTTLPMGGAKGGSDFDPKGKSRGEIMRFCQSLALELFRHLGPDTDIPAGDIGVGGREVGYMAGMIKKITNDVSCVFTGKGLSFGGSLLRPEATGYGLVYFADEMLHARKLGFEGMRVSISGSGNVAQYAAEKSIALGARVVTLSDSGGTLHAPDGFTPDQMIEIVTHKNERFGRLADLAELPGLAYLPGLRPWHVPADIALPCATHNELDVRDAEDLIKNGVQCVAEGANMPTTLAATKVFRRSNVLFAPGKAANAGGVATSGLEISQNAMRLSWGREEVDTRLQQIMQSIHESCLRYGARDDGRIDYVDGANVAGFVKVADAMLGQGII